MPSSGIRQPAADGGDLTSHLQQSPLAVHGIWPLVVAQRSKLVALAAKVNLSLTDPQATWATKDVSALVSTKAAWILINLVTYDARWTIFSYRPFGSTANPLAREYLEIAGQPHIFRDTTVLVPLDYATKKFDYQCDSENKTTYHLLGYLEQGA